MGILRDFERRLEGAVEGVFGRMFKSGVQPVELGKRLRREMGDHKSVGVNRNYVPNVYTFELSTVDRERFKDYEGPLTTELATVAVETARENNWAMMGRARIEFATDDSLTEGRFRVAGKVEADEPGEVAASASVSEPAQSAGPLTAMLPGEVRQGRMRAPASMTLLSGPRSGTGFFPLDSAELTIGRGENAGITLADPGISRMHARIVREGDDFVVEDLGSTNGTEVNGQLIKRRRLADGDRVRLGSSTLQFRRER
jgi:FhaA, N-terminal domain/FHA domain